MAITRIHHLNCASLQGLSLLGQHLVCHVLLLETSDAGLVLVDTGLGAADYADVSSRLGWEFARLYARPVLDPSLAAIAQIRELGFSVSDVRHIVQTHLDLDHVGGLSDFPEALVHVHATELDAARRRHGLRGKRRYRPKMWAHDPKWRTYTHGGEGWMGFDAVHEFEGLGDDILMVPLFGHTHGHCGIAVNTSDGWLLDAGDAYFDAREIKLPQRKCGLGMELFQLMVTTERASRRHNQDRLRSLRADHPEVEIFCAHNPFEYMDLAERNGSPTRGIGTTRGWKPANRRVGSARNLTASRDAQ
jgi:glyoxylase-like metal-dependent hydrolase (beta-lactamase superfamily II)